MSDTSFNVSHGLEVVTPKSGRALAIPLDDWGYLRKKVNSCGQEPSFFSDLGFAVIGAAIALIASLLSGVPPETESEHRHIAEIVSAALVVIGGLCLVFQHLGRKSRTSSIAEIGEQMDLIESRYDTGQKEKAADLAEWAVESAQRVGPNDYLIKHYPGRRRGPDQEV